MLLYRPVGLEELRLIAEADMRAFPPRLPDQPIFYPVLSELYATTIARDWNTKAGTKAGFVTRFSVADSYCKKFEHQVVGSREHRELWIPAEDLPDFNARIEGTIEVIGAFFGEGYRGQIGVGRVLGGRDAADQLAALVEIIEHGDPVLVSALAEDHTAVFLNFSFWETSDALRGGVTAESRDLCLETVEAVWNGIGRGAVPLGTKRVPASAPSEAQAEVSEPPTPERDDLTAVGYWSSDYEPDLPDPRTLVGSAYDPHLRSRVCAYLEAGAEFLSSLGHSYCRFECGIPDSHMGSCDLTDGAWVWPEGLAHYVRAHDVRLPDELLRTMEDNDWRIPEYVQLPAFEQLPDGSSRIPISFDFWYRWSGRK